MHQTVYNLQKEPEHKVVSEGKEQIIQVKKKVELDYGDNEEKKDPKNEVAP